MKISYLDHAATSSLLPEAKEAMIQVLNGMENSQIGNASSLHYAGQNAKNIIEDARKNIAQLIGADPAEIIFTSGGTESNNTVANIFRGQKIAVSSIEHPSMLESAKAYARELVVLPVDEQGIVQWQQIPEDADLVSIMLANNELGTIEPIMEIKKRCKNYNTFLHSDATQALGKIHIDVKKLGVDYLTISAHKIGGPIGIGALYVRKDSPFKPLLLGGHQEKRRRAGTSNALLAAGFGAAAKWCWGNWSCKKYLQIAKLRDELCKRILNEVPYSSVNGFEKAENGNTLPNILNMSFQAAEGESIQLYLDADGITVSTGSACAAGDIQPSHVLMAISGDAEVAHSSIRFSLGLDTTTEDVDHVMTVLPKIIKRLQGISTIKIKEPK